MLWSRFLAHTGLCKTWEAVLPEAHRGRQEVAQQRRLWTAKREHVGSVAADGKSFARLHWGQAQVQAQIQVQVQVQIQVQAQRWCWV